MTVNYRLQMETTTHVGQVRTENEDSIRALADARIVIVADGMGGHSNGKFAAEAVVEAVANRPYPADMDAACDALATAVTTANTFIHERSIEIGQQMGTTFVALILRDDEFAVLWAGDSRAYVYRDDQLVQLSSDHSQVQSLIDSGLLTEDEGLTHPMRHVLARAIGVQPDIQIDAVRDFVKMGDLFLLCSDGVHGLLSDAEIYAIVSKTGQDAGEHLLAACLDRGAPDNVSVAIAMLNEPTLLVLDGAAA